jgi:hypothetical protein
VGRFRRAQISYDYSKDVEIDMVVSGKVTTVVALDFASSLLREPLGKKILNDDDTCGKGPFLEPEEAFRWRNRIVKLLSAHSKREKEIWSTT